MSEQLERKVDEHEKRLGAHQEIIDHLMERQQKLEEWKEKSRAITDHIKERHKDFEERLRKAHSTIERVDLTQEYIRDQLNNMPNSGDILELKGLVIEAKGEARESVPKSIAAVWAFLTGLTGLGVLALAIFEFYLRYHG